ncbi:MAG: hypothetical protein U1E33_08830 [Rhodospirillales bacterium]
MALYGDKPLPLRGLLTTLQAEVADVLGSRFTPYHLDQIHGTIVGLERAERQASPFVNRNFAILRGSEVTMDFDGLLRFFRTSSLIPFAVQIGGFGERDDPFTSRGARPFDRSLSLHGHSAVVMGWPVAAMPAAGPSQAPAGGEMAGFGYPPTLAQLRRDAERFGIVHAYHATAADRDNDFYFRIGLIDAAEAIKAGVAETVARRLRRRLAAQPPVWAMVGLSQLSVAFYATPELPCATTQAFALDDPIVTGAFIANRLGQGGEERYNPGGCGRLLVRERSGA